MILRRRFNIALLAPIGLIAISLWLLIGCLYIPTGPIVFRTGSKQDFRPLVGDPGSGKPIVVGRISRAGVMALLGKPPYEWPDHHQWMYVIHVKKDIVIFPLCFEVASDSDLTIGLVLTFNDSGVLTELKQESAMAPTLPLDPIGPGTSQTMEKRSEDFLLSKVHWPMGRVATPQDWSDTFQPRPASK